MAYLLMIMCLQSKNDEPLTSYSFTNPWKKPCIFISSSGNSFVYQHVYIVILWECNVILPVYCASFTLTIGRNREKKFAYYKKLSSYWTKKLSSEKATYELSCILLFVFLQISLGSVCAQVFANKEVNCFGESYLGGHFIAEISCFNAFHVCLMKWISHGTWTFSDYAHNFGRCYWEY